MRANVVDWLAQFMPYDIASLLAPGWFTCVGLAGIVGMFVLMHIAKKRGLEPGVMASIVLWLYLAAVSAGIIVPMIIEGTQIYLATGHFVIRWAGMTSFWGYLAGIGAVAVVCRHHKIPLAYFGDLGTVPMGVALFFARLGCFLGGCDYGKVTSVPWAMRFPQGSPAWADHVNSGLVPAGRAESLPVHPTQLYESLLGIAIIVVSMLVARTAWAKARAGRTFLAACATYAIGRIIIEMFRADVGRGIYLGLSSGQIFSVCTLLVVAAGLFVTRRRLITTLATAGVLLALVVEPNEAAAQPAPPAPAPAPQPADDQPAQPAQPPLQAYPQPYQPYPQAPQQPFVPINIWGASSSVGLLAGSATPLNRRNDQVKQLFGATLSVGVMFGNAGIWADLDSFGNADATHGTLLVSGGTMFGDPKQRFRFGVRGGFGVTLVNFHDPVFHDITGTTLRAEGLVEYDLSQQWMLWTRPIAFDYLTARDLGGPIVTWQFRIGVSYKFGNRPTPPPAPPPSIVNPYPPPPPPPQCPAGMTCTPTPPCPAGMTCTPTGPQPPVAPQYPTYPGAPAPAPAPPPPPTR